MQQPDHADVLLTTLFETWAKRIKFVRNVKAISTLQKQYLSVNTYVHSHLWLHMGRDTCSSWLIDNTLVTTLHNYDGVL